MSLREYVILVTLDDQVFSSEKLILGWLISRSEAHELYEKGRWYLISA